MRTVAGVILITAALAACDATARTTATSAAQASPPDSPEVWIRSYLRSRFTLDLPTGYELDEGQGSTDYVLFTVLHAGAAVLTIYVGDWAIDTADQELGFASQFGGRIADDQARERLIARSESGDILAVLTAMPGTRAYIAKSRAEADRPINPDEDLEPPPTPRYLLVEIRRDLTRADRAAAEAIAQSVRPRPQAPPA